MLALTFLVFQTARAFFALEYLVILSEQQNQFSQVSEGSALSWNTRIKGFIVCFIVGIFLSVLGSVSIFFRNFIMFALLFSLGSICSICSTFFLMGPIRQMKKMIDPNRWIASVIAVGMIILTLLAGLVVSCYVIYKLCRFSGNHHN
ncbi:unnamed protein product [Soboliphyme baturini]|uniref:Vesicle transport protein n=1 Tax=Soboliphyme baturini TaxID=241478 RepID=A0A183ID93_9BILA|nr:unnamed protein product [Soboliphyme baturini]